MSPDIANQLNWWLMPEQLRQVRDQCGADVALALIEHCGGMQIYIPTPAHIPAIYWADRIGQPGPVDPEHYSNPLSWLDAEQQTKLAQAFGGSYMSIPRAYHALLALRNQAICEQHSANCATMRANRSAKLLAQRYGLTERHIWHIISGVKPSENQTDIFGG